MYAAFAVRKNDARGLVFYILFFVHVLTDRVFTVRTGTILTEKQ